MSVVVWIVLFAVVSAVCGWIALGNGTETFAGLLMKSVGPGFMPLM